MNFSHYAEEPVRLAVDLVNTDQIDGDELANLDDLNAFLGRFEDLRSPLPGGAATEADLAEILRLRDTLRRIFDAADEASAVAHLNSILDEHAAIPRLSLHSGEPHLHFEPVEATVPSWVGALTAMGLAGVIVEHGVARFGSCNAGNCRDVFVDTTRNRSRLHCCHACSTREAVAAYRKRQSSA